MDVSTSLHIDFLFGLILEDASGLLSTAQVRLRPTGPPERPRPQVTCPLADGPGHPQTPFAGCEPTCEVPRALVSEQCNCWVPGKHASSRQSVLAPVSPVSRRTGDFRLLWSLTVFAVAEACLSLTLLLLFPRRSVEAPPASRIVNLSLGAADDGDGLSASRAASGWTCVLPSRYSGVSLSSLGRCFFVTLPLVVSPYLLRPRLVCGVRQASGLRGLPSRYLDGGGDHRSSLPRVWRLDG